MVPANSILPALRSFVALIRPHSIEMHIGGSMRRQQQDVKDVEVIVMPDITLHAALDAMVEQRVIEKAIYSDGKPRWGERYRGILFEGVRFEIFCCDHDNHGYQLWMRTGPGDANKFVMGELQRRNSPFGFQTWGYFGKRIMKKGKPEFVPDFNRKLHIPDEQTIFSLLGMDYIEPCDRSLHCYKARMNRKGHQLGDATPLLIPTMQAQSFLEDEPLAAAEPSSRRVLDIDVTSVEPYVSGSSFKEEHALLTRLLLACGDTHPPTEDEVVLFAERRYQHWDRCNWRKEK